MSDAFASQIASHSTWAQRTVEALGCDVRIFARIRAIRSALLALAASVETEIRAFECVSATAVGAAVLAATSVKMADRASNIP